MEENVVLLEIFPPMVKEVEKHCKDKGIEVKIVFISPLSDEDYEIFGCSNEKERAIATEATMTVKLRSRETENEDKIKERAYTAIKEVEEARKHRDKEVYIVNHFGEDMKTAWAKLQERVGKKPEYYEYGKSTFRLIGEIDKTFRQFLEQVFPELINP